VLERAFARTESLEGLLDPLPVDKVPPCGDILRTTVPAINVIGVLPNVDNEESLALALNDGVAAIMAALDAKLAILADDEEHPSTAKVAHSSSGEGLLELLKAAEVSIDLLLELLAHFMGGLVLSAGHAEPVEVVVEELTSLVAHGASGFLHDFAEGLILELLRSRNELRQLGCVALVVLLVVELDSLSGDVGLKSVLGIRQFDDFVSGHSEDNKRKLHKTYFKKKNYSKNVLKKKKKDYVQSKCSFMVFTL